jgi:HD domain
VWLDPRTLPPPTWRKDRPVPRVVIRTTTTGSPYPDRMPASPQRIATQLLADVGTRLPHTRRVAKQASMVSEFLEDRWSLAIVDAAWLHDIGHSPTVSSSGFHPLDGARWLRAKGFSEETCSLVAWHTGAIHEARERGLEDELRAEFAIPPASALDALTWADLTSSPSGDLVSPEARLDEIVDRYEPGSAVRLAIAAGLGDLLESTERIEQLLGARIG